MSENKKIFIVSSPVPGIAKNIVLYEDTWSDHIITKHPEMEPHLESVRQTVQDPSVVQESHTEPGNFLFVNLDVVDQGNRPLRVPVKPLAGKMAGKVAVVRSAYFAEFTNGPIVYRRDSGKGDGT